LDISITGRHIEMTESMTQFTREKVSRLQRLYDRIEAIGVVAEHRPPRFWAEIVLRTDHKHTFVAQVEAEEFHEAVDLAIDKMERQLREHKEKLRNRKHHPGPESKPGM
jgi:putative sigma-54 modulation protein